MKDINLREYQAIDPKDRTRRRSLEIRRKDRSRVWLKYADRYTMALNSDATELTIFFYSMSAIIGGRNLTEVATAIDGENLAWVQEFDPLRFDRPAEDARIIGGVELFEPKKEEK